MLVIDDEFFEQAKVCRILFVSATASMLKKLVGNDEDDDIDMHV